VPGLELLVRALTDLGERERAKVAMLELSNIAKLIATIPLRAAAEFAFGYFALGDGKADAARQHFEDAVDLYFQSGAPFEAARARIELARALGKLGRIHAAMEEAQRALALLTELKAELEIARAQTVVEALAAMLQTNPKPRSQANGSSDLTKREMEVLRLVAEGMNNQSIAERLFVSDHTVHRHLANILRKLSVSTRAAAVAQAARRGLFT
jgi:DNA-binding NarL/FixJ family response regulator